MCSLYHGQNIKSEIFLYFISFLFSCRLQMITILVLQLSDLVTTQVIVLLTRQLCENTD